MSDETKFEAWGLLELFGHQRIAGKLSEETIGGCHFIRIDVPENAAAVPAISGHPYPPATPAYTRYFTQGAIYSMTPTSEAVARKMAANLRTVPIQAYDLPRLSHQRGDDDYNQF
jgi:hypothetical protein